MQNSEVPYVRYLIGRIMKAYDYINRFVQTLPLSVYEGTWTTLSPLVAMHHHVVELKELSLKARLDRGSRDVIELNMC